MARCQPDDAAPLGSIRLVMPERTAGNQRRYRLSQIDPVATLQPTPERKTLAYARVSSHDQKDDLERQKLLDGVRKAVEESQA